MADTFADIKTNIRINLGDLTGTIFSPSDINDSVQDAYDEIVAITQCIVKKVTGIPFKANLNYYDMTQIVGDYLATTAIFSNLTNLWLLDDKTLKDFDKDRIDWENWNGAAVWWAPCNDTKHIAIVPKQLTDSGTFDLYYWATAPSVVDTDIPLIQQGFRNLIELYSTADLLEQVEEFTKAQNYWNEFYGISADGEQNYDKAVFALAIRTKNIAKSDLTMLG